MTCRHGQNDTDCSSHPYNLQVAEARRAAEERKRQDDAEHVRLMLESRAARAQQTPDASNYEILDAVEVGNHLVLKVKYPNCARCAYEGVKVLVFLGQSCKSAIRWRKIDPHFRDNTKACLITDAPGPAARFPASAAGWSDALAYAKSRA